MKMTMSDLHGLIVEELKNAGVPHERTTAGHKVLRLMHNAPGVLEALQSIESPKELAHVIEELIDSVPIVRREDVLRALTTVTRHEKKTHTR